MLTCEHCKNPIEANPEEDVCACIQCVGCGDLLSPDMDDMPPCETCDLCENCCTCKEEHGNAHPPELA